MARDTFLTLMTLMMLGLALVLGGTAVPGNKRRSLYPVLARPSAGMQYLSGKMLGIALTLVLSLSFDGLCACLGVSSLARPP